MRIQRQTRDVLWQTFHDLWAHKLRSFLTMFGIAWGMLSLLLLGSVGEGARRGQRKQMAQWGEDRINYWGFRVRSAPGAGLSDHFVSPTEGDCALIMSHCPLIRNCAPELFRGNLRMESAKNDIVGRAIGEWPNSQGPRFLPVKEGRFINDGDVASARMIAVVGNHLASQLFPNGSALGGQVLLNQNPFLVVGVLESIGPEGVSGLNDMAFVPLSSMRRYFPPKDAPSPLVVNYLMIQPVSEAVHKEAMAQFHAVIGRRYGVDANDPDAFDEWDTSAGVRQVESVIAVMDIFLGSVGVITLALGAIGVMNIMLVAVGERTHEIGVRKALGATSRDILVLFLMEGLTMVALSGGAGLLLGWGITRALLHVPMPEGFLPPVVTWSLGIEAFVVLSVTALGATLIPARQAAQLPPAGAMRHEA
jgi:putative ABC transport system permease protein